MKIGLFSFGYPDKYYRVKNIFTHELMQSLSKKSEVIVFDLSPNPEKYRKITFEMFEGVSICRIPNFFSGISLIQKIKTIFSLRALLRREMVDFYLFNFLNLKYLFILFFISATIKKGIIVHGVDAMIPWEKKIIQFGKKIVLKKMNFIFPVSDYTTTLIQIITPHSDYDKIIRFYNGIKKEKFHEINKMSPLTLRKEMNLPNKKIILSICDLVPRKCIDICIKADRIIKNQGVDFIHIIIGRGPEEEYLKQLADDLDLKGNMVWIDYIDNDSDLVKYYKVADVYTMISKTTYSPLGVEGFGISYIEAEYLGIPIVGGNSGGVSTAVKHGFTGFLIDPTQDKPETEAALYLYKILSDEKLYKKMSENAHEYVESNFDWDKNANIICNLMA